MTVFLSIVNSIPKLVLWVIVIALSSICGMQYIGGITDSNKINSLTAQVDEMRIKNASDHAEYIARESEIKRQQSISLQEVKDESTKRIGRYKADADNASSALNGLRSQLAKLSARVRAAESNATPSSGSSPIEAVGELLGDCAARYRSMAEEADRDRNAGIASEQLYDKMTRK